MAVQPRTDGNRLYAKLARSLAAQIAAGDYPVGGRLPSERDIAATAGVSRPTVREAILALELDGLVEVRTGSGVYVAASTPAHAEADTSGFGPFEILEARALIEGETCALAATLIDDGEIAALAGMIDAMEIENDRDIELSEMLDRRFHHGIAEATRNSALVAAVDALWTARERSPQYRLLTDKVRRAGVKPRADEHQAILAALRKRDPHAARNAMRDHLRRVIDSLLQATESEAIEQARATVAATRQRYGTIA
jgi:DNA-binding FadR family transcriptional regulator